MSRLGRGLAESSRIRRPIIGNILSSIRSAEISPNGRWIMLFVFAGVVVLSGGGSRSDIASLPFLRSFAVIIAFLALTITPVTAWRPIRAPVFLLGALAIWMVVQMVPLPTNLWTSLPGRDLILAMDEILGYADRWRPISLTPSLTLNSLLSLAVPSAALLLAAATPAGERERLWWIIWTFALASSMFALMQFIAGPRSAAYLYRITNEGSMVGLFANRNHHALLLALAIPISSWLIVKDLIRKRRHPFAIPVLSSSIALFFVLLLITGSRLGLICSVPALIVAYIVVRRGYRFRNRPANQLPGMVAVRKRKVVQTLLNTAPIILITLLGAFIYLAGKANSIDRLIGSADDGAAEMRVAAFGTVVELLRAQWVFGSGFGSFAKAFQVVEPDLLLRPSYLNHAHNDWLQFPIEGGVPAVVIALAAIVWLIVSLITLARHQVKGGGVAALELLIVATCFAFLALGSLVDYPLRQPSIMMLCAFLTIIMISNRLDGNGAQKKN